MTSKSARHVRGTKLTENLINHFDGIDPFSLQDQHKTRATNTQTIGSPIKKYFCQQFLKAKGVKHVDKVTQHTALSLKVQKSLPKFALGPTPCWPALPLFVFSI